MTDTRRDGGDALRQTGRLVIADLIVDLDQLSVMREGRPLPLPGLSFDLLVALARAAPRVMTHDELLDAVWRGVVVSPETVSQRVKLLRDALGDDAREPRYVAGVRGRGYRLVAPVEWLPTIAEARAPTVSTSAPAVTVGPNSHVQPRSPAEPSEAASSDPGGTSSPNAAHAPDGARAPPASARQSPRRVGLMLAGIALVAGIVVAIVSVRPPRGIESARTAVDVVAVSGRTVAVLPFQNLSPEPSDAYVGLGVAETVLNRLATARSLQVVARSSSFAFEEPNVDAREIGRKLGARYLVQGGVQRAGERLRVTASIVDAESGRQLHSVALDRAMADLFALQDDVAAQLAAALDATLAPSTKGPANPAAHLAYLQGLAALGRWRVEEVERSIELFRRAQSLDPTFALALVGEATARIRAAMLRGEDVAALERPVLPLVERALALDPRAADAYVARAHLRPLPADAERDLRRAISLAPSAAEGYFALGELLANDPARLAEALDLFARAVALDPLRPRYRYVQAIYAWTQHHDEALLEKRLVEIVAIDPDFAPALTRLALQVGSARGRYAEAVEFAERAFAKDPRSSTSRARLIEFYLALEETGAAASVVAPETPSIAFAAVMALIDGDAAAVERLLATPGAGRPPQDDSVVRGRWNVTGAIAWLLARDVVTTKRKDWNRALEDARILWKDACEESNCAQFVLASVLEAEIGRLEIAAGRVEEGRDRLERLLRRVAPSSPDRLVWHSGGRLVAALASAALGRSDDALDALAESWATGQPPVTSLLLAHWRGFDALRDQPKFRRLLEEVRGHVAAQRAELDRLRTAGKVPARGPPVRPRRAS